MNNTTFLDVDESLMMKNLLLPDKERDALDDQLDELRKKVEEETIARSSILIQPLPGICIKTKTTSGEKVFVNICTSDKIPAPEDIPDDKLLELLNDEHPDYAIPISMGMDGQRMEMDKSNVPCSTFDVMLNTTYFKKCREKRHFMSFTILAILHGLTERYNIEIDCDSFVILKNRTVMGKLQQHKIQNQWIQDTKKPEANKPLIEEILRSKISVNKVCLQNSNKAEIGYTILRRPLDDPVESLIVLFDMTKTMSVDDVVLLINSDRINITDEKACCAHDVLLPYNIKKNSAKAYLDYNLGILRVDVLVQ